MIEMTAPLPARLRGYDLQPVREGVWRVGERGHVIGHLFEAHDGRVHARRFHTASRAFVELGGFCRIEDAVAALHDSR